MPNLMRPIPEDFAEIAASMSRHRMVAHYRVCKKTLARWIAESGATLLGRGKPEPPPADFRDYASSETNDELARRYQRSKDTITRWRRETGVFASNNKAKTPAGAHRLQKSGSRGSNGKTSRVGDTVPRAAQYLQRDAQVFRCTPDGKPKPTGSHYRYGRVVLTDDEVVARAERKGFKRDWSAL